MLILVNPLKLRALTNLEKKPKSYGLFAVKHTLWIKEMEQSELIGIRQILLSRIQ